MKLQVSHCRCFMETDKFPDGTYFALAGLEVLNKLNGKKYAWSMRATPSSIKVTQSLTCTIQVAALVAEGANKDSKRPVLRTRPPRNGTNPWFGAVCAHRPREI